MATNLHTAPAAGNGGRSASAPNGPRWGAGRSDPVARYVSEQLLRDLTPRTVENLIRGAGNVFERCGKIIEGFIACGDHVRLTGAMKPIDAALLRMGRPEYSVEVVKDETETDQGEQIAQDMLNVAPSREAALLWIRRSQAARAAALRLELAVAAKWQIWL